MNVTKQYSTNKANEHNSPHKLFKWLNCKEFRPKDLDDLLQPANDHFFTAIPISNAVNKVENNGADIQLPVEIRAHDTESMKDKQLSMFED